jgi:hypothetical protein
MGYDGYNGGYEAGYPLATIPKTKPEHNTYCLFYKADIGDGPWRPSIFMPRWASRITLEITDIKVERVQEITFTDLKKEGMDTTNKHFFGAHIFENLWNSINAKRGYGWESNPFVWVISFKRVEAL